MSTYSEPSSSPSRALTLTMRSRSISRIDHPDRDRRGVMLPNGGVLSSLLASERTSRQSVTRLPPIHAGAIGAAAQMLRALVSISTPPDRKNIPGRRC